MYAAERTVPACSAPVRHSGLWRGGPFRAEAIVIVLWVCCCAEFFWGTPERWEQRAFAHTPFAWKPTCVAAVLCI